MMQVENNNVQEGKDCILDNSLPWNSNLMDISLQLENQVIDGLVNEKQLFHWVYECNITQDDSMDICVKVLKDFFLNAISFY